MTKEEAIDILQEDIAINKHLIDTLPSAAAETIKNDILAYDMAIEALEQQPCDDCISRQAVLDQAVDYGSNTYLIPVNSVKTLPSVTPKEKTGHWIYTGDYITDGMLKCSSCGYEHDVADRFLYCPNCGKRQEVEE